MTRRRSVPDTPAGPERRSDEARAPAADERDRAARAGAGRLRAYQELVEACGAGGCPVCRCLRARARGHLRALLGEHVTDPETRRRLNAAWGFCAAHAAMLPEVSDPALGTAIVYQALVDRACAWLAAEARGSVHTGRRRRWRGLLGDAGRAPVWRRPRRGRCPVCVELVATERTYLDAVVDGIREPRLGAAYAGSSGLCLPHVELALAHAGERPGAARLAALTLERLRGLADDLRRFIDKHDYRERSAFTAGEAAAWTRALELVAGRPELFGHELERGATGQGEGGLE